jgi:hypothetical protein
MDTYADIKTGFNNVLTDKIVLSTWQQHNLEALRGSYGSIGQNTQAPPKEFNPSRGGKRSSS